MDLEWLPNSFGSRGDYVIGDRRSANLAKPDAVKPHRARAFNIANAPTWRTGDKVKVVNGVIRLNA